jgi:hypothetical protein
VRFHYAWSLYEITILARASGDNALAQEKCDVGLEFARKVLLIIHKGY